jgi:cytochrome d ubiquinol oxidase subunit I
MQHPVGFTYNPVTNRAELTNFLQVLTQNTAVIAWAHTMSSSFLMTGTMFVGISAYLLVKNKGAEVARATLKLGAMTVIVAGLLTAVTGDMDSKIMVQQQPMKMAAAEGLYNTESSAGFSLLTIGNLEGTRAVSEIKIPGLLSYLATGSFDGEVKGINDLQNQYVNTYGQGWYAPNIPTTYWTFRLMIGIGMLGMAYGIWALWVTRKGKVPTSKFFLTAAKVMPFLPLMAISFGWMFTEIGRQPWVVFGVLKTANGVSGAVTAGSVLFTMIGFTALYGALAVVEFGLFTKTIKQGPPETVVDPFDVDKSDDQRPLTFAY